MGFIQTIIDKHKEKIKLRNDMCDNLIMQIDTALREITILFADSQSFVEPSKVELSRYVQSETPKNLSFNDKALDLRSGA